MRLPDLTRLVCVLDRIIKSLPGMAAPYDSEANKPPQPSGDAGPRPVDESMEHRSSGLFTALALYAILVFVALRLDGYSSLWRAIAGCFTGSTTEARVIDHSLVGLLGVMGATVTTALPLALATGALGNLLYGEVKSHMVGKMFSGIKNHYLLMTGTVTAEELFARLLFIGVPLYFTHGHLPLAWFWVVFLLGDIIWAAIHLANFKDPKERHVLRTLPQFVVGVVITAVFVNFGFFGALMVHLAYNNLLFSMKRKCLFNRGEYIALAWHGLVVMVSGFFLVYKGDKSLLDMTYWLNHNATDYNIPGWSAMDYFWGVLMATSLLYVIADLLLFDLYRADAQKPIWDNLLHAAAVMLFAFGAFYGLRVMGTPFEMRVAVMAVIFMVIAKTASGSGMSRVFWIGIPWLMILLYATLALGFASPVWFILLAVALVEAVDDVIRIYDRKWEEATGRALALVTVPAQSE